MCSLLLILPRFCGLVRLMCGRKWAGHMCTWSTSGSMRLDLVEIELDAMGLGRNQVGRVWTWSKPGRTRVDLVEIWWNARGLGRFGLDAFLNLNV